LAARRILVIDDERVIHTFLKAVFEKQGFRVTSAVDALQGPLMARQLTPDLIVLDIALPGGGGYKVFERLRMMKETTGIPILVYSALPKDEVVKQISEGTDVAFVGKPSSPEELVATANRLLAAA
jgi:DNA-binding response OmpR family regulator